MEPQIRYIRSFDGTSIATASVCSGCQSPVRLANSTTSVSVMVRPGLTKVSPTS